jgi:hypothetical protein
VSEAALHAVADALRLSAPERQHLLALAGRSIMPHEAHRPDPLLTETMHAIPFPACIMTSTWEVIDCNSPFRRVWALAEDELPFNAIERLFIHPSARAMHGERFHENIRPVIAMLHFSMARHAKAAALRELRDRLLSDDAIRAIWNENEIASPFEANAVTIDSEIGPFRYRTLTLPLMEQRHGLVVHVPDDASKDRLSR